MAKIAFISFYDELCKGIRYLAAAAESAGHTTEIILLKIYKDSYKPAPPEIAGKDNGYYGMRYYFTEEELHLLLQHLKKINPDIIGMTLFSFYTGIAEWLSKEIRKDFPDKLIIWGGIDVMANPDRAIQTADIICIGDGEYPLVDLLDSIDKGKEPVDIPNLWIKKKGTILKNPPRKIELKLDNYPIPKYSTENTVLIRNNTIGHFNPQDAEMMESYILTTRGCPYNCGYCYPSLEKEIFTGNTVRMNSVDRVIKDIKAMLSVYSNAYYLKFADDIFAIKKSWAEEFRDKYKAEIGLPFRCYIHHKATKFELMKILKDAGLDVAIIGVQTASRRILDNVYNRPFYAEMTTQKVNECHELDIWVVFDLILFNPFETEEDLKITLDFVLNLERPYGFPFLGTLMLFENFPVTRLAKQHNLPLKQLDNSNVYFSENLADIHTYYYGLFGLAAMEKFPRNVLHKIIEKGYFGDNPDELVQMMRAFRSSEYLFVDELWIEKKKIIGRMNNQLLALKGSRVINLARKMQNIKGKLAGILSPDSRTANGEKHYSPDFLIPLREQNRPNLAE